MLVDGRKFSHANAPPNQKTVLEQSFSVPQNTRQIQPSQEVVQNDSNGIIAPIPMIIPQNFQPLQQSQISQIQTSFEPITQITPQQIPQSTPQNISTQLQPQWNAPTAIQSLQNYQLASQQIPQKKITPIPIQIPNNQIPNSQISLPSTPQQEDENLSEKELTLEEKKKITQEIIDKYTDGLSVKDLDEQGLNNLIDMFLLPEEERNEKRAEIEKEREKIQIEMEEIMKDAEELKWILDEAVNYVATNKRQLRGLDNDVQELKELNEFDIDSQLANI